MPEVRPLTRERSTLLCRYLFIGCIRLALHGCERSRARPSNLY
jgi:hypothetical protein